MIQIATRYAPALSLALAFASGCNGSTQPSSQHDSGMHPGQAGSSANTGGAGGMNGTAGSTDAGAGNGGGSGAGGAQGSGGSSSGNACTPACGQARDCCGDVCVNLQNDPLDCGACKHKCSSDEYCTAGLCSPTMCQMTCGADEICCGNSCCGPGQLCCDQQGPLARGPLCTPADDRGSCPPGCAPLCKCASPNTEIATPNGSRRIAELAVGDLVYSVDGGVVKAVPIVRTQRTPVSGHRVVRVKLASGSVLEISALHPSADGRTFADLRTGDALDGIAITDAQGVAYAFDATYDILPLSDTGAYFAGGVLIGSTLAVRAALVTEPTAPASTVLR